MKYIRILSTILLVTFSAFANRIVSEERKIEFLLDAVKSSNVAFIRNGNEYKAKEAYKHLKMKLKAAQNSWFSPSKEKWTALLFIENVASRSSISGKPYLILHKDGKTIETNVWLKEKLKDIEEKNKTHEVKQE